MSRLANLCQRKVLEFDNWPFYSHCGNTPTFRTANFSVVRVRCLRTPCTTSRHTETVTIILKCSFSQYSFSPIRISAASRCQPLSRRDTACLVSLLLYFLPPRPFLKRRGVKMFFSHGIRTPWTRQCSRGGSMLSHIHAPVEPLVRTSGALTCA